jgi:hypothetical protein
MPGSLRLEASAVLVAKGGQTAKHHMHEFSTLIQVAIMPCINVQNSVISTAQLCIDQTSSFRNDSALALSRGGSHHAICRGAVWEHMQWRCLAEVRATCTACCLRSLGYSPLPCPFILTCCASFCAMSAALARPLEWQKCTAPVRESSCSEATLQHQPKATRNK